MAKRKVMITVDEEINDRWNKVSKRLKLSKSGMVEDFLLKVLPVLEKEEINDVLGAAFKEMGKSMNEAAGLFDDLENEK